MQGHASSACMPMQVDSLLFSSHDHHMAPNPKAPSGKAYYYYMRAYSIPPWPLHAHALLGTTPSLKYSLLQVQIYFSPLFAVFERA